MFKNNLRSRFEKERGIKAHEHIPKYADWLEQLVEEKSTSTNSAVDEVLRCITYIDNYLSAGNVESARKWCKEVRTILSSVA